MGDQNFNLSPWIIRMLTDDYLFETYTIVYKVVVNYQNKDETIKQFITDFEKVISLRSSIAPQQIMEL
jgi:hypothetical protein